MKQIKISENTKNQLDVIKDESETYNNVVSRLIRENQDLKQDKKFLSDVVRKLLLGWVINNGKEEIPNQDDITDIIKSLMTTDQEP